jgi:hypothetical protein
MGFAAMIVSCVFENAKRLEGTWPFMSRREKLGQFGLQPLRGRATSTGSTQDTFHANVSTGWTPAGSSVAIVDETPKLLRQRRSPSSFRD